MTINVGNNVFVPRSKLGIGGEGSALYETNVLARRPTGRSIQVALPRGKDPVWIGTRLAHSNIGLLIIQIGDYSTEASLLEPLSKSILQFFRVMLTDSFVRLIRVRTENELAHLWRVNHPVYSHVVLTGHGRKNGIKFGDSWVDVANLVNILNIAGVDPKIFVSLCCETGRADFARAFSAAAACSAFIAPYESVHGAVASNLCQSYFAHYFLEGMSAGAAFNRVKGSLPDGARFRYWNNGHMA